MLTLTQLSKSFDGFQALHNVNFELEAGEKHAVIGPNGAGKTTLFNVITGHLKPSHGEVTYKDRRITGLAPHRIVRLGIARSFQRINIYPKLSVFENVQAAQIARHNRQFSLIAIGAALYRDETAEVLETVGLAGDAAMLAGLLAYGKQKQLELAIALASKPELLLLDEPTAGMSTQETAETIALIGEITSARGLTLLFTEHDMNVVFTIADRISVLHLGELIATGTPEEVRRDENVRKVYLGGGVVGAA